jgi:hypothetical protein
VYYRSLFRFRRFDAESVPELALYNHLQIDRDDAYSYYNALLNSLSNFCAALELKSKYQ